MKKLFRNCFIVGRRFRLAHVRFGKKVIEVSTFRRAAEPEEGDTLIRRDNTFGTPEEDAFRRDFTVNALFYDIATFSVIDWVRGLTDLEARVIRSIGDPGLRFREDPVRMLRAVALASRLGFTIDRDSEEAIRALRGEIVRSSPARVLEEIYKILRQGRGARDLRRAAPARPPRLPAPGGGQGARGRATPRCSTAWTGSTATAPAGCPPTRSPTPCSSAPCSCPSASRCSTWPERVRSADPRREEPEGDPVDVAAEAAALGADEDEGAGPRPPEDELDDRQPRVNVPLSLPCARRDLDRLRVIRLAQRRLTEIHRSPEVKQVLGGRPYLEEALRFMEIHGGSAAPALVAHWRGLDMSDVPSSPPHGRGGERSAPARKPALRDPATPRETPPDGAVAAPSGPRRRRRRRRRRPGPPAAPAA